MTLPKVAVVTGGHVYDVQNFHRLFRGVSEADVYIQHMDDFASSPEATRNAYDVLLFYIMLMEGPKDDGLPWYSGKPKTALESLGRAGQGIFVLHHAILAYPQWPVWNEIVGIRDRKFDYYIGESIRVDVVGGAHPIVKGLKSWDMVDETYAMADTAAPSEILLSVDHPKSMKHIAWTRKYKDSRVFCLESGHDNVTWQDPNFREVIRRGILWCAGKL